MIGSVWGFVLGVAFTVLGARPDRRRRMTWPTSPMPETASAILLLPSGHRAFDEDFTVTSPAPKTFDVRGEDRGIYYLMHLHMSGVVDGHVRALYVLGGHYMPYGAGRLDQHDPDEAHDQ